jgi:8-oxo-dGTP diphosphatase
MPARGGNFTGFFFLPEELSSMPVSDQGFNPNRFQVIPRSLIFVFNSEGEVLLLKGAPDKKIWAGHYNGIGGHVEAGEDILSSAYRELREEAGISEVSLRLVGQVMVEVDPSRGIALFIFKGLYAGGEIKSSSEGELAWIDLSDLSQLPVVEDLPELLPRVRQHRAADPLLIGKYQYNDGKLEMLFV